MASSLRSLILLGTLMLFPCPAFAGDPPTGVQDEAVSVDGESPLSDAAFLASHQPEGASLDGAEMSLSDEELMIVILGTLACVLLIILIV